MQTERLIPFCPSHTSRCRFICKIPFVFDFHRRELSSITLRLVMDRSALACPWLSTLLAAPILAGLLWAMRGLASTKLCFAGLGAALPVLSA